MAEGEIEVNIDAGIEVDVDANVDLGVEVDANVDAEMEVDDPMANAGGDVEVEVEVEVEAPVVEVEVEVPEGGVNLGGELEVGFEGGIDVDLNAEVEVEIEAPAIDIDINGSGMFAKGKQQAKPKKASMKPLIPDKHKPLLEDDHYHHFINSIFKWLAIQALVEIVAVI